MNGAQAILESLKREQVDIIFGYPGGAVLDLYDALYQTKYPHILYLPNFRFTVPL